MSIIHLIWLLSFVAACAFAFAGYLVGAKLGAEVRAELEAQRDQANEQLTVARTEVTWSLQERDEAVGRANALMREYHQVVAERDAARVAVDEAVAARNRALNERDLGLAARDRALGERDEAVAQRLRAVAQLETAAAESRAQEAALTSAREDVARLTGTLRANEKSTQHRIAMLEHDRADTRRHIEHLGADKRALVERAQTAERRAREAEEKLRSAESLAARADELEAQVARQDELLHQQQVQNEQLTERVEQAAAEQAELEATRRALEESRGVLEETQRELDDSRRVLERTRQALEDLPDLERVVAERDEFLREIDVMQRRMERLEMLEERASLATSLAKSNEALQNQLAERTAELAELRALRLAQQPAAGLAASEDHRPAGSLESFIAAIAEGVEHRSTVVADDLGFPVVGVGAHQEPLAALCGVLGDVRRRASGMLPLGRIRHIMLETEHGVTISAFSEDDADLKLTLATVTAGPAQETLALRQALVNVTSALRRGTRVDERRES